MDPKFANRIAEMYVRTYVALGFTAASAYAERALATVAAEENEAVRARVMELMKAALKTGAVDGPKNPS